MKMKWRTVCAWVAGLFGVTACDGIVLQPDMYGCPYADYNVDILITDEAGAPVEGIKAGMYCYPGDPNSTCSRKDGHVVVRYQDVTNLCLLIEDIDGPENGGDFQSRVVERSELNSVQVKKGKDWYEGEFNVTGTVKLQKKQ